MISLFELVLLGGLSWMVILFIDRYIVPRLNPESRFVKQWKSWFVDEDPYL